MSQDRSFFALYGGPVGVSNINGGPSGDAFEQANLMQGVQTQGQGFQSRDVSMV